MSGQRPRGQARDWTDAQLDDLTTITQADIERAQEAWKRDADPKWRELLSAEPIDETTADANG